MYHLLKQFIALAETHSYTRASSQLYISQPALTKNMKNLEKEFGGELIERTKNGCYLTDFGKILYKHSKSIENEMHLLHSEMNQARLNLEKHVTIAYGILWQVLYAAEIMLRAEEKSDNQIVITGKGGPTEPMIEELLKGRCDLFLGKIPENLNKNLNSLPLLSSQHSIFAHKDHPLHKTTEENKTYSLEDLKQYKWLIFGSKEDLSGYEIPQSLRENVEIQTIHDINSMFIIIRILQKSSSLILLPSQVGELLRLYDIRQIENHNLKFNQFMSGLIFRKGDEKRKEIQIIIEIIKSLFI